MINRRNIRIKAVQAIYGFDTAAIQPEQKDIDKSLDIAFEKTSKLLYYLIQLGIEIAKYVEIVSNQRSSKHITTKADLSVNIKLAGNHYVWDILENKSFQNAIKNYHIEAMIENDVVKKLFLELEQTPEYNEYIGTDARTIDADNAIMQYIFENLIIENEDTEAVIYELFQNYNDDIEMLYNIIIQSLTESRKMNFGKLISLDKRNYAKKLVDTIYSKKETISKYIIPKLKNWDPERVAVLDMIILNLGIAELLYFETIPVKVTLNEYIDIAKEYSTPQSGQFVNGILDNIHKDLVKENKLHKVDFRKF